VGSSPSKAHTQKSTECGYPLKCRIHSKTRNVCATRAGISSHTETSFTATRSDIKYLHLFGTNNRAPHTVFSRAVKMLKDSPHSLTANWRKSLCFAPACFARS